MMSVVRHNCLLLPVLLVILVGTVSDIRAVETAEEGGLLPERLLLLPLQNLSGQVKPLATVDSLLQIALELRGINLMAGEELRPVLKRNRIRPSGRISPQEAATLQQATGCDYLMICSLDIYREQPVAEVTISGRIIQLEEVHVITAAQETVSAQEYYRPFLQELPFDQNLMLQEVAVRLLDSLEREVVSTAGPAVILVPFENGSELEQADDILFNSLVAALFHSGYGVIEPGLVHELFLHNRVLPTGEISRDLVTQLNGEYAPEYLLTGCVEEFSAATGADDPLEVLFEYTARVIAPSNGHLLTGGFFQVHHEDNSRLPFSGHFSTGGTVKEATGHIPDLLESLDPEGVPVSE